MGNVDTDFDAKNKLGMNSSVRIKARQEVYVLILNTKKETFGKRDFFATDHWSLFGMPAKFPTLLTFSTIGSARSYASGIKGNWIPSTMLLETVESVNADIYAEYEAMGYINRETEEKTL